MTPPAPGRLGLTTWRQAITAALAGAVAAGVVGAILDLLQVFPPVVPWTLPAVLTLMALAAWLYSRNLARRIRERAVESSEAFRALVVAKSAVLAGAVLAGVHLVYVGDALRRLPATGPAARAWLGGATLVASVLFALAGIALERACRVPGGPDSREGKPDGTNDTPA